MSLALVQQTLSPFNVSKRVIFSLTWTRERNYQEYLLLSSRILEKELFLLFFCKRENFLLYFPERFLCFKWIIQISSSVFDTFQGFLTRNFFQEQNFQVWKPLKNPKSWSNFPWDLSWKLSWNCHFVKLQKFPFFLKQIIVIKPIQKWAWEYSHHRT